MMNATTTATVTNSHEKAETLSAELIITIAPPCAGKSTWLQKKRQQQQRNEQDCNNSQSSPTNDSALIDICLDNQPNVYIPIPQELFCMSSCNINSTTDEPFQRLLNQSLFQKTIRQRLLSDDQQELRWVLQRLTGKMSRQEFETSLRTFHLPEKNDTNRTDMNTISNTEAEEIVERLVDAAEGYFSTEDNTHVVVLPETIDLFVVEVLFQNNSNLMDQKNTSHPSSNWTTGIERAIGLLKETPRDTSVAWGNTNTKPRDYIAALEIAQQQRRPVHFCVYQPTTTINDSVIDTTANNNNNNNSLLCDLPYVGYGELLQRNMKRLMETGRYIPAKVIWECSKRVEKLVNDVLRQIQDRKRKEGNHTSQVDHNIVVSKLDFDRQLARLAQFELHGDRTVSKLPPRNNYQFPRPQQQWQRQNYSNQFNNRSSARGQSSSSWRSNGSHPPSPFYRHEHSRQNSQFRPYYPGPSRGGGRGRGNPRQQYNRAPSSSSSSPSHSSPSRGNFHNARGRSPRANQGYRRQQHPGPKTEWGRGNGHETNRRAKDHTSRRAWDDDTSNRDGSRHSPQKMPPPPPNMGNATDPSSR